MIAVVALLILFASMAPAFEEVSLLSRVDHLVYGTPDLAAGIEKVERLLGVNAVPGGQHPGAGTRNALIRLGELTYLEIIGPDPDQPKPAQPRRFGIDELKTSRLVTWAAKGSDLEAFAQKAKQHGVDLGRMLPGSRRRPDGVLLSWRLTASPSSIADGIVPFFIDWGATEHPASSLPKGCTLVSLRAQHHNAERVRGMLAAVGVDLRVEQSEGAALIATIRTPRGNVELR
jgi:alkylation response protein AidB-like acyl-CoA dehydrogenase